VPPHSLAHSLRGSFWPLFHSALVARGWLKGAPESGDEEELLADDGGAPDEGKLAYGDE
jgi:hypothetical protein